MISGTITQQLYADTKDRIYRYSEEPFTLSSGKTSHHYFNCKKITMHPEYLARMAAAMRDELIPGISAFAAVPPAGVGGLTLGSDPIAFALSLAYREKGTTVYPIVVRKEQKQHGTGRRIEGELDAFTGGEVLLIDDVVTTGGASLKAVEALRFAGLKLEHGICIVDREEGGRENLAQHGVTLHSLFTKSDFVDS